MRRPVHVRLGLPPVDAAEVQAVLGETRAAVIDRMEAMGQLIPDARAHPASHLAAPLDLAELVAVALAAARASGDTAHSTALRLQYLEALPSARLDQLVGSAPLVHRLFHSPTPWHLLPRFRRGLAALYARLAAHGLDPHAALGAGDVDAYLARFRTLADWYVSTYWGGIEPMFQALPHDLAAALPADADDDAFWAAVDHRLALPMLHEILHFGADRETLLPPYLDESLAGWFGVALDEGTAFPALGDDNALVGWPWFAQVGEALCRAFGEGPVLAAQAGLIPWQDALPPTLVATFARLGWQAYRASPAVHFHPDTTRPDRWVRLIYAAATGADLSALTSIADVDARLPRGPALPEDPDLDRQIVYHALSAMCLEARQVGASWRVRRARPTGPVVVDFARGDVTAPARDTAYELAPARYALPPSGRLDRHRLTLEDVTPAALRTLAQQLVAG